jgi:selenocysteine lyase/cysteine desulfurase
MLDHSLSYITALTIPAIQAHAQQLIGQLRDGLRAKGYTIITPPGTTTPLLTALHPDARARLAEPLAKAQVRLSLHDHHFRIAPSVFNDDRDVDRLLSALPPA